LHEAWKQDDFSLLTQARGTFCAIHYQLDTGKLFLLSDKLAIRPLYYFVNEKFAVFATALRIFENFGLIPLNMDLRGVTEITGFGYPLDSRTPYANVSALKAAEIVRVDEERIVRLNYWRWDEIGPSNSSEPELLREASDLFASAVASRNRHDRTTIAYLSGGMDSRCIVTALSQQNVRIHTFNFALPGTQDFHFGNEFARKIGAIHQAAPKSPGDFTPDYSALMAKAWNASEKRDEWPAERPALAWSGEGGSVALGHVHMNQRLVALMRAGHVDEAIETFLRQESVIVLNRLLKSDLGHLLSALLREGVREELAGFHSADAGRNFYLFLMLSDQRRKLSDHFENIDLHRLELQLPFFDSEFLKLVISIPIELCLGHKFYTKWLERLSPIVMSVPWQTYPGHVPCPIPIPQELIYQWDDAHRYSQVVTLKPNLLRQAREMLRARDFPDAILKRSYLGMISLIFKLGLRDYSYVIPVAAQYHKYWRICGGRYAMPQRQGNLKSGSS
jgi:asparagine synthetase B (glutamine-hydrolysing)